MSNNPLHRTKVKIVLAFVLIAATASLGTAAIANSSPTLTGAAVLASLVLIAYSFYLDGDRRIRRYAGRIRRSLVAPDRGRAPEQSNR